MRSEYREFLTRNNDYYALSDTTFSMLLFVPSADDTFIQIAVDLDSFSLLWKQDITDISYTDNFSLIAHNDVLYQIIKSRDFFTSDNKINST